VNFICHEKLFAEAVFVFLVAAERPILSPTLSKGKGEYGKFLFYLLLREL
jgi:hypothetical protein